MTEQGAPPPHGGKAPAMRKEVSPAVAVVAIIIVIAVCVALGYKSLFPQGTPKSVYVNAARYWTEKPEREKLAAQGMARADVDRRIQEMWDRGELKLPPGEPGVDWAGTPNGIVMIPKGPGDMRAAGTGPAGGK